MFLSETLNAIYSHLDPWDLENSLRVCRLWRSTLASRVARLTLPLRVRSDGSAEFPSPVEGLTRASWLSAVRLFSKASYVALRVDQEPWPPEGCADSEGQPIVPAEARAALQGFLSRVTSLELALLPGGRPHHGPGAASRGPLAPEQQQQHRGLQDALSCVRALCSAGAVQVLSGVERLRVWGGGRCFLTPAAAASLMEQLPALTHLDLAAAGVAPEAEREDALGSASSAGAALQDGALELLLLQPLGAAVRPGANGSAGSGGTEAAAAVPAGPLDLPTVQALLAALPPQLRHLSAAVSIGETDSISAWAHALRGLPPGLTSLRLLGPLCHCPDLAAVVAGWATSLPRLRRLELDLVECCHSHADLEAQLYDDPDCWTSSCWHGVFPTLTQLRTLQLSMDSITDGLWCDMRACSHLTCLRLHPTSWSGMCEAPGICALTALRELAITVSEPSELQELSTLTQLTRLDLEMLGLDGGVDGGKACAGTTPPTGHRWGLLRHLTDGLSDMRRLRIACRSAAIDAGELGLLRDHCPALSHLEVQAPFRRDGGTGRCDSADTCLLPRRLRLLALANTNLPRRAAAPLVRLAGLPVDLVALSVEGLGLEVVGGRAEARQDVVEGGGAGGAGDSWQGPCTLMVRAVRCTLRCALTQLCGHTMRSLDLYGTALEGAPLGPDGAGGGSGSGRCGDAGLNAIHGRCCDLRRLGLWGCGGQLRPFNDAALAALVMQHPGLRELALTAGATTRSGLSALAQLIELRSLQIAVSGQDCAAALGTALASLPRLALLEVVLPVLNFAGECVRDHLVWSLPSVCVRLRAPHADD